jgi:hypothetical protein
VKTLGIQPNSYTKKQTTTPKQTIWTKSGCWYQHSIYDIGWYSSYSYEIFHFQKFCTESLKKSASKSAIQCEVAYQTLFHFWLAKYCTVELQLNLHKDPFKLLSFQLRQPSSIKSSQLVVGIKIPQCYIHSFKILELKPQRKKRWSRLSVPLLQNTQLVLPVKPQASIRSPVESLLLTANQRMKACFGIARWCQTNSHQPTIDFFFSRDDSRYLHIQMY